MLVNIEPAMNIFTKTINQIIGKRSLSGEFSVTPKSSRSIIFNLAGIPKKEDRYTGIVFACVDAIQSQACQAKPRLIHYDADGNGERDFNHPLIKLLFKPNSKQTWHDIIKWTVGYRELYGTAFWYLVPPVSGKKPVGIFVLDPTRMQPVYDDESLTGDPIGWQYTSPMGQQIAFNADEIMAFPYFSPFSQSLGIGPLQAATIEQDNELAAQNYVSQLYRNGAMPSGVLSSDQELTDETVEKVRSDWKKTYEGQDNIGKTLILEQGLKYERLSLSMQDLAFTEGRKDARESIMQIFRVPRSLLGSSATITRANAEADVYSFAKNKIQPMMEEIFDRMNYYLLPLFGLDPTKDKLEFKDLVPENRELTLKENETYLKSGVITINEVRSRQGLEAVAWGDEPFLLSANATSTPQEPQQDPEERQYKRSQKDARFNHEEYRREFYKIDKALVKQSTKKIETLYADAAQVITDHLARYWINEERSKKLSAADLQAVTRAMPGEVNSVMDKVQTIVHGAIAGILIAGAYKAGQAAYKYLKGEGDNPILRTPKITDWVFATGLEDAEEISQTMKKKAQEIASDAIIKGESAQELKKRLTDTFENMEEWKAEQIARTETHKAMSKAAYETALASGLILDKRWDTSGDDDVCEHCLENEAVGWIPMSDAYPSGAMYTGEEHPNGRCIDFFEPADAHKK